MCLNTYFDVCIEANYTCKISLLGTRLSPTPHHTLLFNIVDPGMSAINPDSGAKRKNMIVAQKANALK